MGVAVAIIIFEGIKIVIGVIIVVFVFHFAKKYKKELTTATAIFLMVIFFRGEIFSSINYDNLRKSEAGTKIKKSVTTSNYLLIGQGNGSEFHGLGMCTAFLDVENSDFSFVEVEILNDNQRQQWEINDLELGELSSQYLKFFPGKATDIGCLGEDGLIGKRIDTNKFYCRKNSELNNCSSVCVVAISKPESQYSVTLFDEKSSLGTIRKYGVRINDLHSNTTLGTYTVVSRKIRPLSRYLLGFNISSPPIYSTFHMKQFHHTVLGVIDKEH